MSAITSKTSNENPKSMTNLISSGKVRNIHAFTGLFFETTNRLSVFDRVIKEDVPFKGDMLNCISQYSKLLLEDNGINTDYINVPQSFYLTAGFDKKDLSHLCYSKQLLMFPFEFIVRGYLVGSAYKAHINGKPYCGYKFPKELKEGDKLDTPIITPTTKETTGHDKPIDKFECIQQTAFWIINNHLIATSDEIIEAYDYDYNKYHDEVETCFDEDVINFSNAYCENVWEQAVYSIAYYFAKQYIEKIYGISLKAFDILSKNCDKAGIIFVDTKFEFGLDIYDNIVLADEVGTPDSSRFAPKDEYEKSGKLISLDKQIVRDYCSSIGFTGEENQPIPEVPDEIWEKVSNTYVNLAEKLCGKEYVANYLQTE